MSSVCLYNHSIYSPLNAKYFNHLLQSGGKAHYKCKKGFGPIGDMFITCKGKKWDKPAPECEQRKKQYNVKQ